MSKTSEEIFQEMEALFETMKAEQGKTTKVSKQRARKAAGELKKLVTPYRQASVAESK